MIEVRDKFKLCCETIFEENSLDIIIRTHAIIQKEMNTYTIDQYSKGEIST